MGIVLNQTYKNTLIIFLGFFIGGINVLFLFTHFLSDEYYGLITFLLSTANLIMPLMVLGIQNTIVKYYFTYDKIAERDNFLIISLVLPLNIILPLALFGAIFYEYIAEWISKENPIIKDYTYLIFLVSVFMGYFEVFYAWCRVHMRSVFGNFVREVFARLAIMVLLFLVYFGVIDQVQFIYAAVWVYFFRLLLVVIAAFLVYRPQKFSLKIPQNFKELLSFSFYIILAGSAGSILLEIDKFMIPQMEKIENVAYYAVGVYIASVIGIPARAMQQIINPITAKEIQANNMKEVENLYQKSSSTLLLTGGLLFLLINCNVKDVYQIINKPEYTAGVLVVLLVSISELIKLVLGTNSAILTNSKYYKVFFYFSIAMAVSVILLNKFLIELMGINGAALATLLVVLIFSLVKISYVHKKLDMHPLSPKIGLMLLILTVLFLIFYTLNFTENPFFNILFKSVLISFVYLMLVLKLRLSEELQQLIKPLFSKK